MPFLDTVRKFDIRVRTLESSAPDRYITSEKKNILVETFVKWQITDVAKFYVTVGGNPLRAETRLDQAINDALRAELGRHTVHDVIASQRFRIMETLRDRANEDAAQYGASVLDVRLKRVDLTPQVRESVFRRMEAERKRVANELRSEGFAIAERIRAEAERERTVILAEAQKRLRLFGAKGMRWLRPSTTRLMAWRLIFIVFIVVLRLTARAFYLVIIFSFLRQRVAFSSILESHESLASSRTSSRSLAARGGNHRVFAA